MIQTLLVANRGEIACRIIRTARDLGLRTIAVYSDVDASSHHVEMADHAVPLGGVTAAESYLHRTKILAAAQSAAADAIHPGYGFLSENSAFATDVAAAGLIFVGPSAEAIRVMGRKDVAKARMAKAGVPIVPGYHGGDQDPAVLRQAADDIGYPVLIKAVAGGGGKGMRLVSDRSAFDDALLSAQRESESAFGTPNVLIEKAIQAPRHIEIQVFGDRHGNVVHLYERDCSLQRRHQKVIEEAPAPGMTPPMRDAMCQAAMRAAQAIGYVGAGTVEFIVDGTGPLRPDGFWFMEMNTRLQVEHPVTEAVTGVDLVAWQLRVAAGEPLPLRQEDIHLRGHAAEARLYAEDVRAGFLPATGRLAHVRFGSSARIDSGVRPGDEISPHYDPMIAKVITHGASRSEALAKLARSLEQTEVAGTVTNIGFLARLARHPGFVAGEVDTGLIARDVSQLLPPEQPPFAVVARAALAAAKLEGPLGQDAGFTQWTPLTHRVVLRRGGDTQVVSLTLYGPTRARVALGDQVVHADWRAGGWCIDGHILRAVCHGPAVTVFDGEPWQFDIPDPLAREDDDMAGGDTVDAPMPGLVKEVSVAPGKTVAAGERLVILEAMKMEHALAAPRGGVVAEVVAQVGDQVAAGAALIRLEVEEDA